MWSVPKRQLFRLCLWTWETRNEQWCSGDTIFAIKGRARDNADDEILFRTSSPVNFNLEDAKLPGKSSSKRADQRTRTWQRKTERALRFVPLCILIIRRIDLSVVGCIQSTSAVVVFNRRATHTCALSVYFSFFLSTAGHSKTLFIVSWLLSARFSAGPKVTRVFEPVEVQRSPRRTRKQTTQTRYEYVSRKIDKLKNKNSISPRRLVNRRKVQHWTW